MHPAAPRAPDGHHSTPTTGKPYIKAALHVAHMTTQITTTIDEDNANPNDTRCSTKCQSHSVSTMQHPQHLHRGQSPWSTGFEHDGNHI